MLKWWKAIKKGTQGWSAIPVRKGVVWMTVFEALMFAVTFASLVLAVTSSNQKK